MRALVARHLADAAVAGLSEDRGFATPYNAALQAANMAIVCAGYRIIGRVPFPSLSNSNLSPVLTPSARRTSRGTLI